MSMLFFLSLGEGGAGKHAHNNTTQVSITRDSHDGRSLSRFTDHEFPIRTLETTQVWNIVTSIFVEKALKLAMPDADMVIVTRRNGRGRRRTSRQCQGLPCRGHKVTHLSEK